MLTRAFTLLMVVLPIAVVKPSPALAHVGGLDSLGCHHNRKAGGYHCHRGPLTGQSFASKAEALVKLRQQPSPGPAIEPSAPALELEAIPRGLDDGDTYVIHFRSQGIDTPEKRQLCERANGTC